MGSPIDLTGHTYGRLFVVARLPNNKHQQRVWLCRCGCGNMKAISGLALRTGNTRSCGCIREGHQNALKHGHFVNGKESKEAQAFHTAQTMAKRFSKLFKFIDLEEFINDVGHRPGRGYRLSRVDTELDYQPGNLYWKKPLKVTRWQERGHLTLLPDAGIRVDDSKG